MESIKIEVRDIKKYYEEKEKLFYSKFFSFKRILPFLIFLIIGAFLLINGFFNQYDVEQKIYENGKEKISYINYGIDLAIGLALVIFSILKCMEFWKSRNMYNSSLNLKRTKIEEEITYLKFELTEENIFLKSDLFERLTSWKYYDFFKTDNNFLSLYSYSYGKDLPEMIIPLNSLKEQEKEILKQYLNNRFINKV